MFFKIIQLKDELADDFQNRDFKFQYAKDEDMLIRHHKFKVFKLRFSLLCLLNCIDNVIILKCIQTSTC